jgi:hypothetical protein
LHVNVRLRQVNCRQGFTRRALPLARVDFNGSNMLTGGTPVALPGTVQAERFDEDGPDVAYVDTTTETAADNTAPPN